MEITLTVILSYIRNYLLSFVISLFGAFTSETMAAMNTKTKRRKIQILRIFIPCFFDAFLLCALQSKFPTDFALYALICFIVGMWGLHIVELLTNKKFIFTFLSSLLKASGSKIADVAKDSLDEVEEVSDKEKKTDENKSEDEQKLRESQKQSD